ncbi:MAG: hypothetical protein ABIL25_04925 [candidate division WOR-3 bacterium]
MKALCVIACLGMVAGTATAQNWQQLGPTGATVAAMATVRNFPDDVFLVTEGQPARIYYTSNRGTNWTVRDTIHDRIHAIASDPNRSLTLYCGGKSGKVYRTTDYGYSWRVRGSLGADACITRLAVVPGNSATLWAAATLMLGDSAAIGVFRSNDSGATWTRFLLGTGFEAAATLLVLDPARPQRVFCGGTVNNTPQLYATGNSGGSWSSISSGLGGSTAFGLAVSPVDSAVLVTGTDAGIYRSTNSGQSWALRKPVPAWSVVFAPASPHYGYAGSDNLVFRSNDNGLNWTAETTDFSGTLTRWLEPNPSLPLELYAASGAGVFHTTNGGYVWTRIASNLACVTVPFLYYPPAASETMYTCPPGWGILRSRDRGLTWETTLGLFPASGMTTGLAINPRSPDTVVAVTGFDSNLHLTTDRGDSWVCFRMAENFRARGVCYHPFGPDTLYAWGSRRVSSSDPEQFSILKSTSAGKTWFSLLSRGPRGTCVGFQFTGSGETLYAWGTENNAAALYRSSTHGNTWGRLDFGVSGTLMRDFALSPADTNCFFCATDAGVFRSLNRGAGWVNLGLGHVSAVLPGSNNIDQVFAGTDTQGLFFTTNHGLTWQRDTIGFSSRTVLLLERRPDDTGAVYCAAAGSSLLGRGIIGITEPETERHTTNNELTVQPSVVRTRAQIVLAPGKQRTLVELYRTNGTIVQKIADVCPTPARLIWSRPEELADGVYLLVCQSGSTRSTSKLVVTR